MASLTGNKIKDSYLGLLKTSNNGLLQSNFVRITDGGGNGSQLYLSQYAIRFYDAYTFPSADGTFGQVLSTDASGALSWADSTDNQTLQEVLTAGKTTTISIESSADITTTAQFNGDIDGALLQTVKAAESLLKGDVVYISGGTGDNPEVSKALASDSNKMPAIGIMKEPINTIGGIGECITSGELTGVTLSMIATGAELFVSAITAGAVSITAPTGEANLIQKIAKVIKGGSGGALTVLGAFRTNAVPNLDSGKIFLGNDSNQAVSSAISGDATIDASGAITLATVPVTKGGTGETTLTGILLGNGANAISDISSTDDGHVLTADGSGGYAFEVSSGDVTLDGSSVANQIAVFNDASGELRSDDSISIASNGTITLYQPNSNDPIVVTNSYNIGGGNIANVTGLNNTGFGKDNLSAITSGTLNTAIGQNALRYNQGGGSNVAIGASALQALSGTFGSGNTSIGKGSGLVLNGTTAQHSSNNTFIGSLSGSAMTTGANNVIIGGFTGVGGVLNVVGQSNNIVISDGDGNVKFFHNQITSSLEGEGLRLTEYNQPFDDPPVIYIEFAGNTSSTQTATFNFIKGGKENVTTGSAASYLSFWTRAESDGVEEKMLIKSTGAIKLNTYGSATHTGTLTKTLAVDASGNVIEVDAAVGDVGKSGTPVANQIAIWTDDSTIKGDATFTIDASGQINLSQETDSYNIGGGNIATVTGDDNTGFGKENLFSVTSGTDNTAFGYRALYSNTTGRRQVAIGYKALQNSVGTMVGGLSLSQNTAVGSYSSLSNTDGRNNTSVGYASLQNNRTGDYNTAIGHEAIASIWTGSGNVGIGYRAGYGAPQGSAATGTSFSYNIAIGWDAAFRLTTGNYNTCIGYDSGEFINTGSGNIFLGKDSGSQVTTGNHNVIIGGYTGTNNQAADRFDIRQLNEYVVISDGSGGVKLIFDNSETAFFYGGTETYGLEGIKIFSTQMDNTANAEWINIKKTSTDAQIIVDKTTTGSTEPLGAYRDLTFYTGGSVSMRISSGGNVGIGTSGSPAEKLSVQGAIISTGGITGHGANRTTLSQEGGSGAFWQSYGANTSTIGSFSFRQANSDFTSSRIPLTISSGGNVGIGTALPDQALVVNGSIGLSYDATNSYQGIKRTNVGNEYYVATTSTATDEIHTFTGSSGAKKLTILEGGNVGIGVTPSARLDVLGKAIIIGSNNGNETARTDSFVKVGAITFPHFLTEKKDIAALMLIGTQTSNEVDIGGGTTSYNAATQLRFFTAPSNTATGLARLIITSGGNVGIGTGSAQAAYQLRVKSNFDNGIYLSAGTGTTDNAFYIDTKDEQTTLFRIQGDGYGYLAANAWVYGSDLRLKENISDVENGIDMVSKMKPKHFDYIDGQKNNLGFIAQDVQKIIPQAVSVADEKKGTLGLKTDFLVPYLVKAIQEQQTIIEDLKARIEKLEL